MVTPDNPVETTVVGTTVTIAVNGEFLGKAGATGNIKLWPNKTAAAVGPIVVPEDTQWTFTFATQAEADAFAAQSAVLVDQAKTALTPVVVPVEEV
jgi:hypothetical protein